LKFKIIRICRERFKKLIINTILMKKAKPLKFITTVFLLFVICPGSFYLSAQQENLNVLDRWMDWSGGNLMLTRHLNAQAFALLDARDEEVAGLKTSEDWITRQKKVSDILKKTIGPFPEKTPLNARVTGTIKKDGFQIEKVIYESMPGLYVTAAMFIPDGRGKRPAIIHVSGHSWAAFRGGGTQRQIYNLVRKGFIVFAIDPLGQGERIQYWDEEKKTSLHSSPTGEHEQFGNQMFLSGISPIRYFVWDGIRGVDYLLTRGEVDPDRIGLFGCSGGGTQTSIIAAMDERIKAAVPGCYITGFRRLLESIGPQDAEQNIYHGIKYGITHADLLQVRAPKPLLISSTTRDFFSIQGAIETYQEVNKTYEAFGKAENAGHVTDDAGHGFFNTITDIYDFFQDALNIPGSHTHEGFSGFSPEDMQVTPTGQLSTSIGGDLAFDLSKREAEKLIQKINDSRNNNPVHLDEVLERARELSGYIEPREQVESVFRGRYHRDGYTVEMYALHGEGDYITPLLLFVPNKVNNSPAIIYLHPEGKISDAAPGGKIEQLVKQGYIVAAPDVIGTGEVADSRFRTNYLALLIGRSVVGIQAGDVGRVVNFLKDRSDVDPGRIGAVAFEEMGPVLLHAAAFDNSISSVTLAGSLISYQSVVMNKFYNSGFINPYVAGALTAYDLPDLIGAIAPRKVALVGLNNHMKEPASSELVNSELEFPREVFSKKKAEGNLNLFPLSNDLNSIIDWTFKVSAN
jgi:dienelactone hydrolase